MKTSLQNNAALMHGCAARVYVLRESVCAKTRHIDRVDDARAAARANKEMK